MTPCCASCGRRVKVIRRYLGGTIRCKSCHAAHLDNKRRRRLASMPHGVREEYRIYLRGQGVEWA